MTTPDTEELVKRARTLLEGPKIAERPTIAELEAILSADDAPPVEIRPDGSIVGVDDEWRAVVREMAARIESLEAENARLCDLTRRPDFLTDDDWLIKLQMFPPNGEVLMKYQIVHPGKADEAATDLAHLFEDEFRAALSNQEEK